MKLFIEQAVKGILAEAEYDPTDKRFIVLKGSKVSENISSAPTFKSVKAVKTLREKYVVNRMVIENVCFKSSSTAGNFVTGRSTDGPSTWKDKNGKKSRSFNRCVSKGVRR